MESGSQCSYLACEMRNGLACETESDSCRLACESDFACVTGSELAGEMGSS